MVTAPAPSKLLVILARRTIFFLPPFLTATFLAVLSSRVILQSAQPTSGTENEPLLTLSEALSLRRPARGSGTGGGVTVGVAVGGAGGVCVSGAGGAGDGVAAWGSGA